jgi:RNA polymerase sigma factor (sigma-70 family)
VLERKRLGTLEPENMHPRELRAYLVRSAIHKAIDERKSAERRLTVPFELASHDRADGRPSPDEDAMRALDVATVRELVGELPVRRQAVLRLRFLDGLEPTEIQSVLGISGRTYRKELERAVGQIASRYELVSSGQWHETRRSLVLAHVAGVSGPRRARMAQAHLASCPSCAQLAAELRRDAERVAAVVPMPALVVGGEGPLQRTIEVAAGAKSSISELGSGAKQQLVGVAHRLSDPTPFAGARPGAVAAAIGGCVVLGGGATYCAVDGLPDAVRSPLGIGQDAKPRLAATERPRPQPNPPLKNVASAVPPPAPDPAEPIRSPPATPPAEAGVLTATDSEAGVRFTLDGRILTVRLLRSAPRRTRLKVSGERIHASCGMTFASLGDAHRYAVVDSTRRWPAGSVRVGYRFVRATSRPTRWCRLQHPTAIPAHVAFVMFPGATLSRQQLIERTANRWAHHVAAGDRAAACKVMMSRRACARERCTPPVTPKCTTSAAGLRRSFARVSVQDVAIKGERAAARFSNGRAVELYLANGSIVNGVWRVDTWGRSAGRGYFD